MDTSGRRSDSAPAPASPCEQRLVVVCISPHGCDSLRVYNLREISEVQLLKSAITASWSRGIERGNWKDDALYELELGGRPWPGRGSQAVESRRLMVGIFRCMMELGYDMVLSPMVSKRQGSKDAWVFLRGRSSSSSFTSSSWRCSDPRDVFAISFNRSNAIRIIDAREEVTTLIRHVADRHWGIVRVGEYKGAQEIKLERSPWDAEGSDSAENRVLVANLVAALAHAGYTVYASLAGERGNFCRPDTWIVVKNPPARPPAFR